LYLGRVCKEYDASIPRRDPEMMYKRSVWAKALLAGVQRGGRQARKEKLPPMLAFMS
jgi:hypothetical protein